jgi:hypothetical protein
LFEVVYSVKAYASIQADEFLQLQKVFFGNDLASLIAPVKSVIVEPYSGETYSMVTNRYSTYAEYAYKKLIKVTDTQYAQSLLEITVDIQTTITIIPGNYWIPYLVSSGSNVTSLISSQMGLNYPYDLSYTSGRYSLSEDYVLVFESSTYNTSLADTYESIQKEYFAGDLCQVFAPITTVTVIVSKYDSGELGSTTYPIVSEGKLALDNYAAITLTSGSNYQEALDALLIYVDTKITLAASYEFEYFYDNQALTDSILSQIGIEDQNSVSILNSALNDDGFWVFSYRISTYDISIAETEEERQQVLFASDLAQFTAPLKEVFVDFNNDKSYYIIQNS